MKSRRDDPPGRYFHSDRVVLARGRWYVVTRERMDVGPFATREDAEAVAAELAQALDGIEDANVALALIREFIRRRDASLRPAD